MDALRELAGASAKIDLALDHVGGKRRQGGFGHARHRPEAKAFLVDPAEIAGHWHRHAGHNHSTAGSCHLEKVPPIECFHLPLLVRLPEIREFGQVVGVRSHVVSRQVTTGHQVQ